MTQGTKVMDRRWWIKGLLQWTAVALFWPVSRLMGQQPVTLKQRLQSGLLCRRPEEFAFVGLVADKVNAGQIPVDLTLSTMQWAVKQNAHFPYYYFQYSIRRQAAKIGVTL